MEHEKVRGAQQTEQEWRDVENAPFAGEDRDDAKESLMPEFKVDPADFPIFSRQGEWMYNKYDHRYHEERLSIDETLGRMVSSTANTIATICGEKTGIPKADHVIYLDKSARPVSWLVDEFWDVFSDEERPQKTFLAIDRRMWLRNYHRDNVEIKERQNATPFVIDAGGNSKELASEVHFDINKVPKEVLAGIRALYVEGGIDTEDPEEIFKLPTVLDGKNLLIVDEVKTSGATLGISKQLLKAAIPELESVNGYVFWKSAPGKTEDGITQPGMAPVWYPQDHRDWRGRGVKDINPAYFKEQYDRNPTPLNRALKMGSFVIGEPLLDSNSDDKMSLHLQEEIHRMRREFDDGHILPDPPELGLDGPVSDRLDARMEELGVEFVPEDEAKKNPRAFLNLAKARNNRPY